MTRELRNYWVRPRRWYYYVLMPYWSMIKFGFNIPLVLTSSTICIINSINEDANEVKIPSIVVNVISVFIMSLNNSIKASDDFNIIAIKYENLINDVLFEDIPDRYRNQVVESFKDRYVALQLNGCSGNNQYYKRNSGELVSSNNNIV